MSNDYVRIFAGNNKELKAAFIEGYRQSLRTHHLYDQALMLTGHALDVHILGSILAEDIKEGDAAKSRCRMLVTETERATSRHKSGKASNPALKPSVLDALSPEGIEALKKMLSFLPQSDGANAMLESVPTSGHVQGVSSTIELRPNSNKQAAAQAYLTEALRAYRNQQGAPITQSDITTMLTTLMQIMA